MRGASTGEVGRRWLAGALLLLAGAWLLLFLGSSSAQTLSAGGAHSLALRGDGTVWAFGSNAAGRLGDGTVNHHSRPTLVANLPRISAVAAGGVFSLALDTSGGVWAWGENSSGELGISPLTSRYTPWQVQGLPAISNISAGFAHTIALARDGTVWSWGANASGQLGDNSSTDKVSPTMVAGMSSILAISAGHEHNLAVSTKGRVYAWGANTRQQVSAIAGSSQVARPVEVTGLPLIQAVAAGGAQSLALAIDGTVWSWGDGLSAAPKQLTLSNIVAIAAGKGGFSFALRRDGVVFAWGSNQSGVFGDGTTRDSANPVVVTTISNLRSIAAGYQHVLAEDGLGNVLAWGSNRAGQLGTGVSAFVPSPTRVDNFADARLLSAGAGLNVVALPGGLYVAGFGDRGSPMRLRAGDDIQAIAAGAGYLLALTQTGDVLGWGANDSGQLGLPVDLVTHGLTTLSQPVKVTRLAANASGRHNLALTRDGKLWSWGNNEYGQLGDNSTISRAQPAVVNGLGTVLEVAGGANFSLALLADGSVWSWGDNSSGQLGDGTALARGSPAKVDGLPPIKTIAAGYAHSLAVSTGGELWVWGANGSGQLGLGDAKSRLTPTRAGLLGARLIAAGALHTVAWDGATVWSWGDNSWGQLGVGDFTTRWIPAITISTSSLQTLVAGAVHTAAVADQQFWFWGDDQAGQSGRPYLIERVAEPMLTGLNTVFLSATENLPFDVDLDIQGNFAALSCRVGIRPPQSDVGKRQQWFLAAELKQSWYAHDGTSWQPVKDSIPVYKTTQLSDSQQFTLFDQQDVRGLAGGKLYLGYGEDAAQMLAQKNYRAVYVMPDR